MKFSTPMTRNLRRGIEWGSILLALVGFVWMVQPLTPVLYTVGFWLVLIPGLVYISTTFWPPEGISPIQAALLFVRVLVVLGVVIGVSIGLVPLLR